MKDQFIPYELAVKLKELGFNEKCFGFFQNDKSLTIGLEEADINYFTNKRALRNETYSCIAPLWQQTFDWFREKYNLIGYFAMALNSSESPITWFYAIQKSNLSKDEDHLSRHGYKSFKEARQACLEKLIEIVENENI